MTVTTTSVTTSSIDELQTDEQRRILDTITEVRKQGLEGILSLPQIVVCGDQSAGKSSVLEALAEIPFPRNDNLCTRFATEISFRREPVARLTVKVIPHESRPAARQDEIRGFSETITDFSELPRIMGKAMSVMGITGDDSSSDSDDAGEDSGEDASDAGSGPRGAFSRDILSIEIEGPDRPQLTLVDIPGLIQSSTRGVTDADVAMVTEITDYYIQQPRTICLAVVSATNDAANQPILQRVRRFDPKGERTLGVITKPDRLPHGSGSEAKFLELARNEDVFFKLGWHVIKNRSFEESACSFADRNLSEMAYFRRSNFGALPAETVGIDALRTRLSHVLFEHVCRELPRLGEELDRALQTADDELRQMGESRATPAECRRYLVDLNMVHYDVCRAAVNGNYENPYFAMPAAAAAAPSSERKAAVPFSPQSKAAVARLRAMVQLLNHEFSEKFNKRGHKYAFHGNAKTEDAGKESDALAVGTAGKPIRLSEADALEWVRQALLRNRGKELMGNYNPLLVGELFWEQSEGWRQLAVEHIERMNVVCQQFLADLLHDKTPADVRPRVWSVIVLDVLKKRRTAALAELDRLMQDARDFPINYNHYYTDNIKKNRQERMKTRVSDALSAGITQRSDPCGQATHVLAQVDEEKITHLITGDGGAQGGEDKAAAVDMDQLGCEEILDCLRAIYKVQHKVFVANIVTQVIERHIVRGLEQIFSPSTVVAMPDADVLRIVGENPAARRHRVYLVDRVRKLEGGRDIFRGVLGAAVRG